MGIKLYDGHDKLFLRAYALAKQADPKLMPRPTQRQWTKYSKQQRGAAWQKRGEAQQA